MIQPWEIRDMVREVVDDWSPTVFAQAKPILRVLTLSAVKAGFPSGSLPYLYFVFYKRAADWRVTSDERATLLVCRDITVAAATTPAWSDSGLVLPSDTRGEDAVDKALKETAKWANTDMRADIRAALKKAVAKHGKWIEAAEPELSSGDGARALTTWTGDELADSPLAYPSGTLLNRVFQRFYA